MINRRKVGMTSSQHGLYVQGHTRATMAGYKASQTRKSELIAESPSQFGL